MSGKSNQQSKAGMPIHFRTLGKRGHTRSLSIGKVLPADWRAVSVEVLKQVGDICWLKVTKLA